MDLDALREAVDRVERGTPFVPVAVLAAARAVLDSEEVWRCETHKAESVNQFDPAEDQKGCWLWMELDDADKPGGACSMVRVRLLAEEKL